jgi:hypothetical protein
MSLHGKWLGNLFKSKATKFKNLRDTWFEFLKEYKFKVVRDDGKLNPMHQAKREGDDGEYLLDCWLYMPKSAEDDKLEIKVSVYDFDTKQPIDGLENETISVKTSWTKDEIADAINDILKGIR